MRNIASNLKCFMLFLITVLLIHGWHGIIPNNAFAQTGVSVPEMVNVDDVFSKFMNRWNIPGGSIAIARDGRLIYARGFGYADKEFNELVQPNHLFRIASISKPVTSIAIMKLIDDGLIDVDGKVFGTDGILTGSAYSTILDPRVENITVRHLLHHTSGWGFIEGVQDPLFSNRNIAGQMGEEPPVGPITIIRFMLMTQRLNNEPGTNYFYSNFGFCILGRIIEQVSGQSYENYVKTEILNPLGISEMQLAHNLYENRAPNEVKYYNYPGASLEPSVYGAGQFVPVPYGAFNIEAMDSHGGWIASAIDLVRLLVAVDGFDTKPDILSQSSIQLMRTPSTANSYYGMGWAVNPEGNWWHDGSLPGTSSILAGTSRGFGWAVLFNTRPSNWQDFMIQMDNMVWDAIAIKGITWPTHDLFAGTPEEPPEPIPTTLERVSGGNQRGLTGEMLANPFVVEVRDANGDPSKGVTVTFTVTAGGGTLSAVTVTTNANGEAESALTLGSDPGVNTVEASAEGVSETVVFSAEAVAPAPTPTTLMVSGREQGETAPPVVEVHDENGNPLEDVTVTFTVPTNDGSTSTTTVMTDENGRAEFTLLPDNAPGTYTVTASAEGITEAVTFTVVVPFEFGLSLSSGLNLIHIPLKIRAIDGVEGTIESVSNLYDALGGASTVNFLITYDAQTQEWHSFFVPSDKGGPADIKLTDDKGIIAGLRTRVEVRLRGDALGTNGTSTITLNQGLNLVGLPLSDSRINRVSDLFILNGIGGNVPVIILTDGGEFKAVGRVGDPGDIAITGGQSFILIAQQAGIAPIIGDGWDNISR